MRRTRRLSLTKSDVMSVICKSCGREKEIGPCAYCESRRAQGRAQAEIHRASGVTPAGAGHPISEISLRKVTYAERTELGAGRAGSDRTLDGAA